MGEIFSRYAPLLLFPLLVGAGCQGGHDDSDEARSLRVQEYEARLRLRMDTSPQGVEEFGKLPPMSADDLMLIVEDEKAHRYTRASAASELSGLAGPRHVDRLAALLPGKADALSRNVIVVLGTIGDPRALPALRKARGAYKAQGDWAWWRIEDQLERAISKLEGDQARQGPN